MAISLSWLIGPLLPAIADCSFLMLVAAAGREIVAGRTWRNIKVLAPVSILGVSNIGFHVETSLFGSADYSLRLGIAAVVALITLIGGRIIPSFTRNWLVRENPGRLPVPFTRFDALAFAVTVAALGIWILVPLGPTTATALLAASLLQIIRLVGWAMMTLAVMTRASLGHAGHQLIAGPGTQVLYAAGLTAAIARVAAGVFPHRQEILLQLAAFLWVAAFAGFAILYGPMLFKPRQ